MTRGSRKSFSYIEIRLKKKGSQEGGKPLATLDADKRRTVRREKQVATLPYRDPSQFQPHPSITRRRQTARRCVAFTGHFFPSISLLALDGDTLGSTAWTAIRRPPSSLNVVSAMSVPERAEADIERGPAPGTMIATCELAASCVQQQSVLFITRPSSDFRERTISPCNSFQGSMRSTGRSARTAAGWNWVADPNINVFSAMVYVNRGSLRGTTVSAQWDKQGKLCVRRAALHKLQRLSEPPRRRQRRHNRLQACAGAMVYPHGDGLDRSRARHVVAIRKSFLADRLWQHN